jgi:hypothetical protein
VIHIRRFNNCNSIINSTEANILIFAHTARKEDGFNNSPRQYRLRFVCFSSFLWSPYSQMSGKANWFHSRKDYMTWLWRSLMSLGLCECLKTKQASFSAVACNLFLISNSWSDPQHFWLGSRDGYQVTGVRSHNSTPGSSIIPRIPLIPRLFYSAYFLRDTL